MRGPNEYLRRRPVAAKTLPGVTGRLEVVRPEVKAVTGCVLQQIGIGHVDRDHPSIVKRDGVPPSLLGRFEEQRVIGSDSLGIGCEEAGQPNQPIVRHVTVSQSSSNR